MNFTPSVPLSLESPSQYLREVKKRNKDNVLLLDRANYL